MTVRLPVMFFAYIDRYYSERQKEFLEMGEPSDYIWNGFSYSEWRALCEEICLAHVKKKIGYPEIHKFFDILNDTMVYAEQTDDGARWKSLPGGPIKELNFDSFMSAFSLVRAVV